MELLSAAEFLCFLLTVVSSLDVKDDGSCQKSDNSFLKDGTCASHDSDFAAQVIQSVYKSVADADCNLANPCSYPADYSPQDGEEFDFIVVGAGSAGSVLANRLSEVESWKVLLIEAGGNPTKTSEVPNLFPFLQRTELDWQYQTEPGDNNCLGMVGGTCYWPKGKGLGGSSTINNMVYVRGNRRDYDRWEAEGNLGWGYEEVLPYFKKSEGLKAQEVLSDPNVSQYHGTKGSLKVNTFPNDKWKRLASAFSEGMKELGYNTNPDYNGKNQTGFVRFQGTVEDGRRCSTAKAFLSSVVNRNNLKVSKNSLVTKVLLDKNKAYGIQLIKNEKVVSVKAKKEVILSAGSIGSPQLLMLSGIGPKEHLQKLGISVVKDLPVGENLQDHGLVNGIIITLNYSVPITSPVQNMFNFLLGPDSEYSGIGMSAVGGFINTGNIVDYPDVEFFLPDFSQNSSAAVSGLFQGFNYKQEIIDKYLEINAKSYTIFVLGSLLHPFSRGKVLLKSTDPKEHPEIFPRYLSDKRDFETPLKFYDFIKRLTETKGLKGVGAKMVEIEVPSCSQFKFATKEYRECSLRHLTTTNYHYVGTCKMGPENCPEAVVDPSLKVKGINSLRVIDASVMPYIVSGNTNAATIMIAEKGSDEIKKTWLHAAMPGSNIGRAFYF